VTEDDRPALAVGGPLDGQVLGTAAAEHFDVTMQDRSRNRYVRSARQVDGAVLYDHEGRR
jgi:hypothetical protein